MTPCKGYRYPKCPYPNAHYSGSDVEGEIRYRDAMFRELWRAMPSPSDWCDSQIAPPPEPLV